MLRDNVKYGYFYFVSYQSQILLGSTDVQIVFFVKVIQRKDVFFLNDYTSQEMETTVHPSSYKSYSCLFSFMRNNGSSVDKNSLCRTAGNEGYTIYIALLLLSKQARKMLHASVCCFQNVSVCLFPVAMS